MKYLVFACFLFFSVSVFSQVEEDEEIMDVEIEMDDIEIEEAPEFDVPEYAAPPRAPRKPRVQKYQEDRKYGLRIGDSIIVPAKYDYMDFSGWGNQRYINVAQNNKHGILRSDGVEIIPCKYTQRLWQFGPRNAPLFKVYDNWKYGLCDTNYHFILPIEYEYIGESKGNLLVTKDEVSGIVSKKGEELIPIRFSLILPLNNTAQLYIVRTTDSLFGLYSYEGVQVIAPACTELKQPFYASGANTYEYMYDSGFRRRKHVHQNILFRNGEGYLGLYSWDDKNIPLGLPPEFEEIIIGNPKLIIAKKGGKYGLISHAQDMHLPFEFDSLAFYRVADASAENSLDTLPLIFKQGDKYGLITINGQVLHKARFERLESIGNGMFRGKVKRGWQLINERGEPIRREKFGYVGNATAKGVFLYSGNGRQLLSPDGQLHQFPGDGEIPVPNGYKSLESLHQDFLIAMNYHNDSLLRIFADRITPSESVIAYFMSHRLEYEGIPSMMKKHHINREYMSQRIFSELLKFQLDENRFHQIQTNNLKTEHLMIEELIPEHGILHAEYTISIDMTTYQERYRIGDLLYIEGMWYSFSLPRRR